MKNRRKYWGWGYEAPVIPPPMLNMYQEMLKQLLKIKAFEKIEPVPVDQLKLRTPRFSLPDALQKKCSRSVFDRASHTYGKSFRDIWRGLNGQFENPPDYVAFPKKEADIQELMAFATKEKIALIPFGGGSSVCGGVEPLFSGDYQGAISVDMRHFDKILEVDAISRTAHIQAGIFGPALERGLKQEGFTLRHFPQSFEFSTLGGWIATRSGGHFATLFTHIDEFVQSIRMITPDGVMETRRLPGSGAGPSEERFLTGSEGIFGIITSARMRLQSVPVYKKTITVRFPSFLAGVEAARALAQSGLYPANARLIDAREATMNGLGNGQSAVLIIGFESHHRPVLPQMEAALQIAEELGGQWNREKWTETGRNQKADAWKNSFLLAPYLRDECMKLGVIMETFETAITWEQFPDFYQKMTSLTRKAIQEYCGKGWVTCRFTHVYPDGCAPYFTVIAKGKPGQQLQQWDAIKKIVSQGLIDYGGTITHHHAVGRDHRPFYEQQRTRIFGNMLAAVKDSIDPEWIMNPGVLLETRNKSNF